MIAAISNMPFLLVLALLAVASGLAWWFSRWAIGVLKRARPLLFTPESLVLALVYSTMAMGAQYAYTIVQVSYLDNAMVIGAPAGKGH